VSILHSGSQNGWFIVAWAAWMSYILGGSIVNYFRRRRSIKTFGASHGLTYLDNQVVKTLALSETSFRNKEFRVSCSLAGSLNGLELAIFDLSNGGGKAKSSQTVVAFRREGELACKEPPIDGIGSYRFELAGDWVVGYIKGRTVSLDELEDWCTELHSLARDLIAESEGRSAAAPHLFRWMT